MGLASFYVGSPSLSQPLDMKPFMRIFQEVTHPSTTLVGFISMGPDIDLDYLMQAFKMQSWDNTAKRHPLQHPFSSGSLERKDYLSLKIITYTGKYILFY